MFLWRTKNKIKKCRLPLNLRNQALNETAYQTSKHEKRTSAPHGNGRARRAVGVTSVIVLPRQRQRVLSFYTVRARVSARAVGLPAQKKKEPDGTGSCHAQRGAVTAGAQPPTRQPAPAATF
jgi:hypothetical protein